MKKVIYTAIFNNYDNLLTPQYIPSGWDFICFTDSELVSDIWQIKKYIPLYEDPTRTAKKYKILPHRFLKEYDISVFIDGNMVVRNNINDIVDKYLNNKVNVAIYDHNQNKLDPRNCIYEEANTIYELGKINSNKRPERGLKNWKDNPWIIQSQMVKYKSEKYPTNNGLITGMVVFRRHNENDCINAMEDWWSEIKYNSKRDQLSFNYVAWKNKLNFNYIPGDSRDNKYFSRIGKHKGKK